MSAIFDQGPAAPCPFPFNLSAHVLAAAGRDPEKIALSVVGEGPAEPWRYGQIEDRVRRLAGGLLASGLQPGARVLMRLGNRAEFPLVFLACITAGLVPVPTSAQLTRVEISAMSRVVRPALIIAEAGVALPEDPVCPVLDLADLSALWAAEPADYALGSPDRPAYIVFTSGTSGRPRAVVQAHRAVWARRMMIAGWTGLEAGDRILHAGAFNWTYTLGTGLLDPWSLGATALIPVSGTSPRELAGLLAREGATIFAAAPGVYRQLLRDPLPALPALRHGLSAGEKLSPALRHAWVAATGRPVHEAFGMSECSTFLSGAPARPAPEGSSGYPQPGRRVAILDGAGRPVAFEVPGVIAVGADDPGLMLEYLGAPEETRARYTADGDWFLTGDIGAMAPDGAVTYLGRDDDMMNAGGYRVSPLEVEAALLHHADITDVAAAEIPVKADTTVIAAFYCAPRPLPEADLMAFAAARLARYKCPRVFIHSPALPRGANGKILRRKLRQDYEATHGQA